MTGHGMTTFLHSGALTGILANMWPQPNNAMPARLAERLDSKFPMNADAWKDSTEGLPCGMPPDAEYEESTKWHGRWCGEDDFTLLALEIHAP